MWVHSRTRWGWRPLFGGRRVWACWGSVLGFWIFLYLEELCGLSLGKGRSSGCYGNSRSEEAVT